jgi:hypothetical protein
LKKKRVPRTRRMVPHQNRNGIPVAAYFCRSQEMTAGAPCLVCLSKPAVRVKAQSVSGLFLCSRAETMDQLRP